jgi:hypothetical protein
LTSAESFRIYDRRVDSRPILVGMVEALGPVLNAWSARNIAPGEYAIRLAQLMAQRNSDDC